MERVEHRGNCQRPGCTAHGQFRYRIDGDAFEADPERGLEAGYRLFCKGCALAIERAVHPYLQLGSVKL